MFEECHENNVLHANARWASIRFEELIATYGCRGDLRGLLKSNTNAAVVESIGAIGADKLSAKRYQTRKGTSYAHSVAHVTGSPVTGTKEGY